MKTKTVTLFVVIALVALSGCAGPNPMVDVPAPDGNIAGFWAGLFHGIVSPFTFIISLFDEEVSFYEVHNNGGWYNFGFVLGAGILGGGVSRQSPAYRPRLGA